VQGAAENRRWSPLRAWTRFHADAKASWGFFAAALVVCLVTIGRAPGWWKVVGLVLLVDTVTWQTYAVRRTRAIARASPPTQSLD
jgi:hypothetical protein